MLRALAGRVRAAVTGRGPRGAALALVLCAPLATAQLPTRPDLPREADPNDWEAYYDVGIMRLTRGMSGAGDALAWAALIDPSRAEPHYARWVAFYARDIRRFERVLKGDERVMRSPEVMAADSLRMLALRRNPFVHQGLVVMLYDALPGYWRQDDYTQGWLAYGQGRLPKAIERFGKLVDRNPERYGGLRYLRASAFTNSGRVDSAAVELDSLLAHLRRTEERVVGTEYQSKELMEYARGLLHLQARQLPAAYDAFARALTENPGYGPAHARIAAISLARGDTAQAFAAFAQAVEVLPDDPVIRADYSRALRSSGRTAEAVAEGRRAVALAPWYADGHFVLGAALRDQGAVPESREVLAAFLARARRNDPRRAAVERVLAEPAPDGGSR